MYCYQIFSRKDAYSRNLKRYFTGEPCLHNHICERRTSSGACIICSATTENEYKSLYELNLRKKELQKIRAQNWYNKNKDLVKVNSKKWKKENPDKVKQSWANWRKKESSKAIIFMRDSLRRVLFTEKKGRTEEILGYSRNQLKTHIEKQFQKGMSWSNHGDWHIDHITPISVLLSQGVTDPKTINCLTNLKPIWARENLSKSNKVEYLI